jgi:hypothetical protein
MSVFLWKVKSAPSAAAHARRALCLVVCERGVCVCLLLYVCASVLRLVYMWGVSCPRVSGMNVHGQVHVPINTAELVV